MIIDTYQSGAVMRILQSGKIYRASPSISFKKEYAALIDMLDGDEAGLKGIPLLVGGNIVIGKQKFEDVEKRFKAMGFNRAFPPGTPPETTIEALKEDLHVEG